MCTPLTTLFFKDGCSEQQMEALTQATRLQVHIRTSRTCAQKKREGIARLLHPRRCRTSGSSAEPQYAPMARKTFPSGSFRYFSWFSSKNMRTAIWLQRVAMIPKHEVCLHIGDLWAASRASGAEGGLSPRACNALRASVCSCVFTNL